MGKKYPVTLTEEFILNYKALPKEMFGWRRFRIEYGGENEGCELETIIYLPQMVDPDKIEKIIHNGQKTSAK